MDSTTAQPPPGCLVILISLSASMADDARMWLGHRWTSDGEPEVADLPRIVAARYLADEVIEALVTAQTAGYAVPLDVAVVGYHAKSDGTVTIVSLLPASEPKPRLVHLMTVSATPAQPRLREGEPRKWVPAVACEGHAAAAAGLAAVYQLVSVWLTGRFSARPPVVIHCTDGQGLDEQYYRVARSLQLLATAHGSARLLHVGFASGCEPTLCGLWTEAPPQPWAGLLDISAELPPEPEGRPARRAVSVNDWSIADAWSAIFDFAPIHDSTDWTAADPVRFAPTVREFWTHKLGNAPAEWEDAFATDASRGLAAVADGASTGIYCRIWADELVKRFIADRPEVRDPIALGQWVQTLRTHWRQTINYPSLNYFKQRKVDETGAAATLLGLEVGPLDAAGHRPWRAFAVGDACLFWVRNGQLIASFPVVADHQFGSAPLLVRSNPGFRTVAVAAAGQCRPADLFLLATDAVAARLLKSVATGLGPDWEQFETLDAELWRHELDELRKNKDMVNDDCTLVVLRVADAETTLAAVRPPIESPVTPEGVAEPEVPGHETAWPDRGDLPSAVANIETPEDAPALARPDPTPAVPEEVPVLPAAAAASDDTPEPPADSDKPSATTTEGLAEPTDDTA
jgi:hypothetical protein